MRRLLITALLAAGLAAPASALAAGGPVPPVQGAAGVTLPGTPIRFVALDAGRATVVERIRVDSGIVDRDRTLPGRWGVPGVAYDGSSTGLSADGQTLVLASLMIRYPQRTTRLLVLDALRLRMRRPPIVLRGSYVLDAVSPDARWLYLIHYPSANDPLRYQVRAYDLAKGRMDARPVVDPREPGEKMTGFPITRASSADGRWAYTLYQKQDGSAFVHALDTAGRTAVCVDLANLSGDVNAATLVLGDGGRTLVVRTTAGPQAIVDTQTFDVRRPAVPAPRPSTRPRDAGSGGDSPWVLVLLPLAALAAASVGLRRRRLRSVARAT
jgi:hypothetical protein